MQLSDMNADVLLKYVGKVNRLLQDETSMAVLLDQAREEVPIIEGLLKQYMLIKLSGDTRNDRAILTLALRDLVIFLALFLMERQQQATGNVRYN